MANEADDRNRRESAYCYAAPARPRPTARSAANERTSGIIHDGAMANMITFDLLDGGQGKRIADEVRDLYAEPPYNEGPDEVAGFADRYQRQTDSPGFASPRPATISDWSGWRTWRRWRLAAGGAAPPAPHRPMCRRWTKPGSTSSRCARPIAAEDWHTS